MGYNGLGPLRRVHETLNARRYQIELIFDLELIATALVPSPPDLVFQQNMAPAHNARTTPRLLDQKHIPVLDWPGISPDLNPIEHLWSSMVRSLALERAPRNEEEYWEQIQQAWASIPIDYTRKLINSMPARVAAVISNKGGHTRF